MDNLKDVYIDQLKDLYSANNQAKKATSDLAKAAQNDKLRRALERGVAGIEDGRAKLREIIRTHGSDPEGEHCKGMEGLAREAKAHAIEEDFGTPAARDAMIISQYQRMAHYAIAGYGCVASYAAHLDLADEADTLRQMLDTAYDGDRTMTEIAEEKVNLTAA
ncbi:DUF892 family protein [Seohaeicola saemankumensis]|uniref:DUF892 family protein n=1 Tax=Seohaeicola saemankumensis TaxID=481181 RepID=UPI001E5D5A90|nr:DUF892 family protein [Seohaeicola saemankumensis]MCD1627426.1 DUF892 family protein [Seohaeicola saemankumensis]